MPEFKSPVSATPLGDVPFEVTLGPKDFPYAALIVLGFSMSLGPSLPLGEGPKTIRMGSCFVL